MSPGNNLFFVNDWSHNLAYDQSPAKKTLEGLNVFVDSTFWKPLSLDPSVVQIIFQVFIQQHESVRKQVSEDGILLSLRKRH